MDSHIVVSINTERAHVSFTWVSPVVTSDKLKVQHHNQDIDIDALKIQNITIRICHVTHL